VTPLQIIVPTLALLFFFCVLCYLLRDEAGRVFRTKALFRKITVSEIIEAAAIGIIFYIVARWTPPS
jgi:membrane protein CcdC involved in cytochrome C biogenesis